MFLLKRMSEVNRIVEAFEAQKEDWNGATKQKHFK